MRNDNAITDTTTLTLAEYLAERDYVILFFTSVGTPGGDKIPLDHPDWNYAEECNWLGLYGTLDDDDSWNWDGLGRPSDAQNNTVTKMYSFVDEDQWDAFDEDDEDGDEATEKDNATIYHTCYSWSPSRLTYEQARTYAQAELDGYGESDWTGDNTTFSSDSPDEEFLAEHLKKSAYDPSKPSLWRTDIETTDEDFVWDYTGPYLVDAASINTEDHDNIKIINRHSFNDDEEFEGRDDEVEEEEV